ncbi:protein FRA10AC1-like [Anopheles albimanus]|uniref:protein FRA10AC1-like n=1 Tax=Anopheles albimanus TaxID=7167 RepID=UPI00163EE52E|nr:protein FRA10AC1-like [Anopheles albimanus]XP_035793481.1 protein FRA10AC1-like [Anopheles albimanus]
MYHRNLAHLNPYELHKHLINEYILTKPGTAKQLFQRDTSRDKTDHDVVRENHRFLWHSDPVDTWEKQLAKKYYDKLIKEYCIADLTRYKENKVALRWRIEKEVLDGKGQFRCGNRNCEEPNELRSWEVNFAYVEHGEKKNALVKLRLCPKCSDKLNYRSKKREVKRMRRRERRAKATKHKSRARSCRECSVERNTSEESTTEEPINDPTDSDDRVEHFTSSEPQNFENNWTKGPEVEEKTREEEFDEYLEDLLL